MNHCDLCGQRVEISTSDEGTSCYVPVAENEVRDLKKDLERLRHVTKVIIEELDNAVDDYEKFWVTVGHYLLKYWSTQLLKGMENPVSPV